MKILIVEDDRPLSDSLRALLENRGYQVETAYDGEAGVQCAIRGECDLVILDVMLPLLDGRQAARWLREQKCAVQILMLTARGELEDRVEGLNDGADYYLTKPFDTRELLARIAVQLRRPSHAAARLCHGALSLDLQTRAVEAAGRSVRLTRTEFAILKLLLSNPQQVVTKSQLLEHIAADTPDCVESSLKVHVSNLRRKLRDAGAGECIASVWGIGFKLAEEEPKS